MRRACARPHDSRLQLIDRSMYALKKPRFLQHDSTLSACQVREEFLQRYHELLQRVSVQRRGLSIRWPIGVQVYRGIPFRTEKESVRCADARSSLKSESDSGMRISRIRLLSSYTHTHTQTYIHFTFYIQKNIKVENSSMHAVEYDLSNTFIIYYFYSISP